MFVFCLSRCLSLCTGSSLCLRSGLCRCLCLFVGDCV